MAIRKKIVLASMLLVFSIPLLAIEAASYWAAFYLEAGRGTAETHLAVAQGCVQFHSSVPTGRFSNDTLPSGPAITNGWQLKNPDATYAVASDLNPTPGAVRQYHFGQSSLWVSILDPNANLRTSYGTWRSFRFSYDPSALEAYSYGGGAYARHTDLEFPLWPAVGVAGLLWFWLLRCPTRNFTRPGHCTCCGYDLRASPRQCPECGTIRRGVSAAI